MTAPVINWDSIFLVVFDIDGTLYDQDALRRRMFLELLADAMFARRLTTLRVLRAYRKLREEVGDEEIEDFERALIARTAEKTGLDGRLIQTIVAEWMEQRPLTHIGGCRYPHLAELFAALRRHGKLIGILSDYPAVAKLAAMGLPADHVVAAGDSAVRILKPHPRGLEVLMRQAGITPERTMLIGDRPERDGYAAKRAGVIPLIRSNKPIDGWLCFASYADPLFAPLLAHSAARG